MCIVGLLGDVGLLRVVVAVVNAAVFPIYWVGNVPMLYGVVVNVIHMVGKIHFIPNTVFPKTPLPNGLLFFIGTAAPHGGALLGGNHFGKFTLNMLPSG